jgi:sodium/potassium-transporting ATPase subunit alpha
MILLDNKLTSIPVAIELGRLVFDNLKKVALYVMPVCTTQITLHYSY